MSKKVQKPKNTPDLKIVEPAVSPDIENMRKMLAEAEGRVSDQDFAAMQESLRMLELTERMTNAALYGNEKTLDASIADVRRQMAKPKKSYVQPGRVGKKSKSLYLDPQIAIELDAMAANLQTDAHALIVELIEKAVRDFRDPGKRDAMIRERIRAYEASLLGATQKTQE